MRKYSKRDIYQEVTDTIIEALENADGVLPWRKPWRDGGLIPRNGNSGRPYNGINPFYLMAVADRNGWTSNDWFTFKGAKSAGGTVRRGEKSKALGVYFEQRKIDDPKSEDGKKMIPFMRHFAVFNREQCDGLEDWNIDEEFVPLDDAERLEAVEQFIDSVGATIENGSRACYVPSLDKIQMPPFGSFEDAEGYYGTLLHELVHWTGDGSRLDRDLTGRFGNKTYSAEELVAEFGSAYLCNIMKVDAGMQHTAYIQNWIRLLKEDKKAIFKCCTEARKASDFLMELGGVSVWEEPEAVEA